MNAKEIKMVKLLKSILAIGLVSIISIWSMYGQTVCPGPWPTSGGVGQPGNWIVIGNTGNGDDPSTGYGNVSYQYSYLDRFVRLSEYVTFLNAVDPGGSGGYVGNLVNVGMIQYSGGWQVAPFTSCSSETGQSMSAAQTGQIALTLISFNLCARFCNWLTSGSVSTGPYTFGSSSPNATPTSVNINYPNSVRMPTEDEFYKAAYYRASNATWRTYGTQDGNLSGGEPIVSGVSSTGNINISNGHLYNQSFHWHPSCGCGVACLWQMRAGQGGQSYYNLYNMVGGFHHYQTAGGSSTTMILRPQNQIQGGAPEQSRDFRLTGADRAEHYASPSLHLVYYGNACCPIAGTPSNLSVCNDNFTSINLFSQLTDESTGGTWTRTAGTGGTFNAGAGTFLPDGTTSASSTFRYTIAASGTCAASTADVVITIIAKKYAGTGGAATECTNSGTVVSLASLLTGADTGGTWTRLTGTGGTFTAASGTYTITSTATTSTFRYRVTNTAPCTTSDATVTVNVVTAPTAGTGSTVSRCDNSTTAINLFALLTGEDTGGTWTQTSGTGGTFNAAAGTYTPAVGATSSTFDYQVGGGTCPVDNESVTINISPQADAGIGGAITDCAGTNNTISLSTLITGGQSGGTWTRLTGTGGTFTGGTTGTYVTTATATTSTFRYTITGIAPCINATADVTVNITGAPTAGTGTSTSVCDNSLTPINLFSLLTGEDTGGTWTRTTGSGGAFNAGAGTFTPAAGATTSTFNYMVGGSGCPEDNETVTVNITPQADAGTGGAITDCAGTNNTISLSTLITGGQSGGTWTRLTGTGGTFTGGTTGTYVTTATATTSTFRYTITGIAPCINATADVTVNITGAPTAGTGTSTSVCDNSLTPINLFSLLTGEDIGGTWTRTTGVGGVFNAGAGTFTPAAGATTSTFNYMVGGSGCPEDNETVTVNITPQADAGIGGAITDCAGTNNTISLSALITGGQSGGTWTRLTGTGGTFTGGTTGTYVTTATATTSTFRYTVAGIAPCLSDVADVTVNVTGAPTSGIGTSTSICDDSTTPINLFSLLTGEDTGGTWTRTTGTGGAFNAGAGTFTPAAGATTSTFNYMVGGSGCPEDNETVTVNITPQSEAGTGGSITDCAGTNNTITLSTLITGGQSGGTWTRLTGTGGTFTGSTTGTYVVTSTATTSTFRYTVAGTAPCLSDIADVTVNVTGAPTAGTGSSTTVCDNSTAPINLNNLLTGEDTGGTWTRTGGTGGTFDAGAGTYTPAAGATTSTFNYMVGGGGCPVDNETVTVNITPQANAGVATSVTDCAGSNTSIDLFSLLTGEQTSGVWTRLTGSGGTFTAGAGTFVITSTAITSTFRYTVTGTAPCVNTMADVTVNVTAAPMSGTGSTMSICDDSTTPINLYNMLTGEDAGGTWTRVSGTGGTFVAATGNFTPALGATSSTFRYTNGGGGCPIDTEDVTVNITPRAYAGLDGTSEGCEGGGIVINLFDAISGEQTGGIWTRLTGTSGVFNAAAGTYALTTGADNSTFQYTVSGTSPCTNDEAIATVNVTGSCCVINSTVLSNIICIDNNTPNLITDNRIRFSMMVTNQNPLLNIYNVTVSGGTTIMPTSAQYGVGTFFTLGTGTAGGGATFIITITDATISGCNTTVNVTDPGNCTPAVPLCPPVKCGTATIQVNGN